MTILQRPFLDALFSPAHRSVLRETAELRREVAELKGSVSGPPRKRLSKAKSRRLHRLHVAERRRDSLVRERAIYLGRLNGNVTQLHAGSSVASTANLEAQAS